MQNLYFKYMNLHIKNYLFTLIAFKILNTSNHYRNFK
jgi:hypothetical protein